MPEMLQEYSCGNSGASARPGYYPPEFTVYINCCLLRITDAVGKFRVADARPGWLPGQAEGVRSAMLSGDGRT